MARPKNHAARSTTPSAIRRESPSAAAPVADRTKAAAIEPATSVMAAIAATDARAGSTSRTARTASWRARRIGSAESSQVAANRPQPVSSPTSQPRPSAMGSQPMTARTTRPRRPP